MLAFHPSGANKTANGSARPSADAIWIDMLDPDEAEVRLVEDHTGFRIPTREDLREIERSSQLAVDGKVLRLNSPVVAKADSDRPRLSHIGMILTPKVLVTVRFDEFKVFDAVRDRVRSADRPAGAVEVFTVLLEAMVDRQADLLEEARERLDAISHAVFCAPELAGRRGVRSGEALRGRLQKLGHISERATLIRDSMLAVGRIAPFVLENAKDWVGPEHQARLKAVGQDIDSLNLFEEHLSNKVQFLLDAVLGFISVEQNDVFKVLTVFSLVGIPPTLVAGIYGMNFKNIHEYDWAFGYQWGLGVIAFTTIVPLLWFKWKRWL